MKRLTYRGIAYQKPEENKQVKRIQDGALHIYRGHGYHYESKKKQVA